MSYLRVAFILLLVLIGCENKEVGVIDSYHKKEMGLKWAKKFNEKLTELENQVMTINFAEKSGNCTADPTPRVGCGVSSLLVVKYENWCFETNKYFSEII
jgi:hypothetical protein